MILEWFVVNEPFYKRYNICRGERIDLYSLALLVRDNLGLDCNIVVGEEGWKPEYSGCNKRLLEEAGKINFTEWDETIKELCKYYRENIGMIDADLLI